MGVDEVHYFEVAVERFGWQKMEAAAYTWAERMRRREEGCPSLVGAWRRALADVVDSFVACAGVDGLYELAERVVREVETPVPRANVHDDAVARWSRAVRALDVHVGAPSSFPLAVLSVSDLAAILDVAEERFGDARIPAEVTVREGQELAA